jgi:hypothetical protein
VVFIIPDVAGNFVFDFSKEDPDAIETILFSENIAIRARADGTEDGSGGASFVWLGITLPSVMSVNCELHLFMYNLVPLVHPRPLPSSTRSGE